MSKYFNYIIGSLAIVFFPVYGILIAVATAIVLDTFTGIFKSIKLNGIKSIRSRTLSNIVSKMLLYEICILLLFLIDKFLLNEFAKHTFGFEFLFTKMCAIVLIYIELVSIKENIEEAYNIDIWNMLKSALSRAKEVRSSIDEISR